MNLCSNPPPPLWKLRIYHFYHHFILLEPRPITRWSDRKHKMMRATWVQELSYRTHSTFSRLRYNYLGGKCWACRTPDPHHKMDCHVRRNRKGKHEHH